MRWLDSLERRFGRWTIPNFPLFIAGANGSVYILSMVKPGFAQRLLLDPSAIAQGEWWRIMTFLFVSPLMNPLWILFYLYLLYYYAQALEERWGEFRFCFFYLLGALATIFAALFIVHATLTNVPLNTTLFLAFATLFPDFQLLLFFILPIKVKYVAAFIVLTLFWTLAVGTTVERVAIAASLVNYLVFFGPELLESGRRRWEVYRNRKRFRSPPEA